MVPDSHCWLVAMKLELTSTRLNVKNCVSFTAWSSMSAHCEEESPFGDHIAIPVAIISIFQCLLFVQTIWNECGRTREEKKKIRSLRILYIILQLLAIADLAFNISLIFIDPHAHGGLCKWILYLLLFVPGVSPRDQSHSKLCLIDLSPFVHVHLSCKRNLLLLLSDDNPDSTPNVIQRHIFCVITEISIRPKNMDYSHSHRVVCVFGSGRKRPCLYQNVECSRFLT